MESYFKIQKQLMKRLTDTNRFDCSDIDLNSLEGQNRARKQIFLICHELHEAASLLHIKKWRGTGTMGVEEEKKFLAELMDSFVFLIEFMILLRVNPPYFKLLFDQVQAKNFKRLEDPKEEDTQRDCTNG